MNNERFAHTADPVFPAAFLFNSVGPGRQSTHQLLVISNTELKYQHLLFKTHKSSICLNLYLFLNFFERTINQFFLSLQPHFFTKEASCSPSLAECMSSVFSLEWALLSELGNSCWCLCLQLKLSTIWKPCSFKFLNWNKNGNKNGNKILHTDKYKGPP